MPARSPFAYIRSHWAGTQGFAWSFWVNLVGLRGGLSSAQAFVFASRDPGADPLDPAVIGILILGHLTVFVWQIVGVLRAGERHLREFGSISTTWGAQLGILIAIMFVLSDIWRAWLTTYPVADTEKFSEQVDRERAERYSLQLSDNNRTLMLQGDITLGATKAVAGILAANPQIRVLALQSGGGNIYEARGLAKLARDSQLDTLAVDLCSSACTIAFIGGDARQLAPGARLGFHQYKVDADYVVPFANPQAEQQRDREIFRDSGVEDWFLEVMFQEHSGSIWYPSVAELVRAGIVVGN